MINTMKCKYALKWCTQHEDDLSENQYAYQTSHAYAQMHIPFITNSSLVPALDFSLMLSPS